MEAREKKNHFFTFTNHKDINIDYPMRLIEVKDTGKEEPSVMEAALIANHVYERKGALQGDWTLAEKKWPN